VSENGNYVRAQARSHSAHITHAALYRSSRRLSTSLDRPGALPGRHDSYGDFRVMMALTASVGGAGTAKVAP